MLAFYLVLYEPFPALNNFALFPFLAEVPSHTCFSDR